LGLSSVIRQKVSLVKKDLLDLTAKVLVDVTNQTSIGLTG